MKAPDQTGVASRKLCVLVADDSAVAREGIAAIIGRDSRYTLCGAAVDRRTAIDLIEQYKPDVLLLEPFLGSGDGLLLMKELAERFPETRILAISKQPEEVFAQRALRAGAAGYWMKTGTCEELIQAIDTVVAGDLSVSPGIALLAVHKLIENPATALHAADTLTDRELHVFGLIGAGFGTNRIAKELGISPRTVETYHEHIKIKLGYPDAEALHRGAREWFGSNHR